MPYLYPLQEWIDKQSARKLPDNHGAMLDFYRQDFGKYARSLQIKYFNLFLSKYQESWVTNLNIA